MMKILLLLLSLVAPSNAFVVRPQAALYWSPDRAIIPAPSPSHKTPLSSWSKPVPKIAPSLTAEGTSTANDADESAPLCAFLYKMLGLLSVVSWTVVSVIVLTRPHPDPKFMDTSTLHNCLTTAQAVCFPNSVLVSVVAALQSASNVGWKRLQSPTYRRLNLGLCTTSLWLAACIGFPKSVSFGYDLIPNYLKTVGLVVHGATALLAVVVWSKSLPFRPSLRKLIQGFAASVWKIPPTKASDDPEKDLRSSLYAVISCGLLWFAALPLLNSYPMSTVPSILGKRLSRTACGFYWLAAIMGYCLKDAADRDRLGASTFRKLSRGLFVGSGLHVLLIVLKVVGIDGGGLLLPGHGLWDVYPAMLAVPFASACSVFLHVLVCMTTTL